MKLLNLDKIIGEDKVVEINGIEYIIPAAISLDATLNITKTSQDLEAGGADPEKMDAAIKAVFDVFTIRDNKIKYADFKKAICLEQYTALVRFIMGQIEDAEKKPEGSKEELSKKPAK